MTDEHTDETTGRIKEAAGVLTGNRQLKREGRLDQAKGSVKHTVSIALDKITDTLGSIGGRR